MKSLGAFLAVICLNGVTAQNSKPRRVVGSQLYHDSWVEKPEQESTYKAYQNIATTRKVEHGRRPVVGVLSEPIRGDLVDLSEGLTSGKLSYVPKAHVQFLEQAGIRVVPIDYHLSHDELLALFEKLNGIYVPGDSHLTVTDEEYKSAFMDVLSYTTEQARFNQEHFPVFFMGNTLTTLVQAV